MTNREWLNTLSNEDFVCKIFAPCGMCANVGKIFMEHSEMKCFEGQIQWLEQEHESEDEDNPELIKEELK